MGTHVIMTLSELDRRIAENIASKLYHESTANHPTIHCNRFPSWGELSEEARDPWRQKALGTA